MPEIVLSTLNARYIHAAFGLRCLLANLGDLAPRAELLEFDLQQRPIDIAEVLLARNPRILGLGVYIWNVTPMTSLVALLRRIRPGLVIVLGGPEVSHEIEDQPIVRMADHVITGEADLEFARLCRTLLDGGPTPPRVIRAAPPDPSTLALPYPLYDDDDCARRIVYVEASRGCPFRCEFCLSSLDTGVRGFPLEPFLGALDDLHRRGVRQFKFVDRTFNLDITTARRILGFFLDRLDPGLFVHFEMIPDRLPEGLREMIARFPPGALQFEIGVQTLNPEVEQRIQRRQDHARLEENLRWLRTATGVHLHVDLIAGLPGEDLGSFAAGFDRLLALGPQEIQVGILKRLRGTPITRHDAGFAVRYNPEPPYDLLENRDLDFATMARLRRFSRHWDLFHNSGLFRETLPLLWHDASPFTAFLGFSDALHRRGTGTSGIARRRQFDLLGEHLIGTGTDPETVRESLRRDHLRSGMPEVPAVLADVPRPRSAARPGRTDGPPPRQARHLAGPGAGAASG